jgi:hypothetical protein
VRPRYDPYGAGGVNYPSYDNGGYGDYYNPGDVTAYNGDYNPAPTYPATSDNSFQNNYPDTTAAGHPAGYVYDEPDTRFEHVNKNPGFDPAWYKKDQGTTLPAENKVNYLYDDEEDTRFKDYKRSGLDAADLKVDRTKPESIQKLRLS